LGNIMPLLSSLAFAILSRVGTGVGVAFGNVAFGNVSFGNVAFGNVALISITGNNGVTLIVVLISVTNGIADGSVIEIGAISAVTGSAMQVTSNKHIITNSFFNIIVCSPFTFIIFICS